MAGFINNLLSRVGLAQKPEKQAKDTVSAPERNTDAFLKIVALVDEMVDQGETKLKKTEDNYAVIYMAGNKKVLHITKNIDPPRTFFLYPGANRVARNMDVPGLRVISKNEARQKKYGPIKAVYTGSDTNVVKDMLKMMDSDKSA